MARTAVLAIGLAILLSAASPASALDSCSCRNLESLQQELENAVYETGFFDSLSQAAGRDRKEADRDQQEIRPIRNSGKLVLQVSANARKDIMAKEFKPPHPKVTGYSGPDSVDMEAGQVHAGRRPRSRRCARARLARRSPTSRCEHEAAHRELCESMGADTYWGAAAERDRGRRSRALQGAGRGHARRSSSG